jgi:hypothetical protein
MGFQGDMSVSEWFRGSVSMPSGSEPKGSIYMEKNPLICSDALYRKEDSTR